MSKCYHRGVLSSVLYGTRDDNNGTGWVVLKTPFADQVANRSRALDAGSQYTGQWVHIEEAADKCMLHYVIVEKEAGTRL